MNEKKILVLKKHGWKTGSAAELLGLSPQETAYVELKISLSRYLAKKRNEKHLTQEQLAGKMHSSQSRIAKMENQDDSVSLDLLVRSLIALGTSRKEMADIFRH